MIILRKIAPAQADTGVIVADTISGTIDGSNKVFYTTYRFKPNRIDLHYNGQALHSPDDFTQTGDNEITLIYVAPEPGELLRATYELHGTDYADAVSIKGFVAIPLGAVSQLVTFPTSQSDTSYNVNTELVTSDVNPSVYSSVVGNKTVNGFTLFFSGEIDTTNYVLEWEIFS